MGHMALTGKRERIIRGGQNKTKNVLLLLLLLSPESA